MAGPEPLTVEARSLHLAIVSTILNGLDHQLTVSHRGRCGRRPVLCRRGIVVARHQPRTPVGWVLILFTLLTLLTVDAGA